MEDTQKTALVLEIVENLCKNESWCGETHIQKATFIAQELGYLPTAFSFILYKHGPFSFDLRDFLTEMRSNLLLQLVPQYPYGPSIKVTERGGELLKKNEGLVSHFIPKIKVIAKEFGKRRVADLERIATALLVVKEHEELDSREQASELVLLNPHIPLELALDAVNEIKKYLKLPSTQLV